MPAANSFAAFQSAVFESLAELSYPPTAEGGVLSSIRPWPRCKRASLLMFEAPRRGAPWRATPNRLTARNALCYRRACAHLPIRMSSPLTRRSSGGGAPRSSLPHSDRRIGASRLVDDGARVAALTVVDRGASAISARIGCKKRKRVPAGPGERGFCKTPPTANVAALIITPFEHRPTTFPTTAPARA